MFRQSYIEFLDVSIDAIVRVLGEDDFVGGGLEEELEEGGKVEELGAAGGS